VALADLTDPSAVVQAIQEADALGRERFLDKYGFGHSRVYFLEYEGRLYDSKAIVGAALHRQHPAAEPLSAADFSGGEQTVQRKLEQLGFTVVVAPKARNPNWTVDELILALDLYLRFGLLHAKDLRVVELSNLLNRMPIHETRPDAYRFRNPNGVALTLANFAALDPGYHGRGMQRGGSLDRDVWERYSQDLVLLSQLAAELRGAITHHSEFPQTAEDGEDQCLEGRLRYRLHFVRERDRHIVDRKKQQVLRSGKRVACEACGFDFETRYGDVGHGFIECHHLVALSSTSGERTTKLEDLALVCSNCHRMIHRKQPWLSIAVLAAALR
jgi:5-methylcytosine-specific restriction protein A